MARQHAGTSVISEGHKEVVNIRTAGAASKCSAGNAIRIRPNSLKPLFGTPKQLVVLVNAFVIVSTWSVTSLLFFYSRCPRAQPFVKVGARVPVPYGVGVCAQKRVTATLRHVENGKDHERKRKS